MMKPQINKFQATALLRSRRKINSFEMVPARASCAE
ncbi:unnamed protein product [Gulo gulo]|uniref:Uncharacterized protein n=1 Tax=Gulo gulo TaxID=48420 RepID=A0A9X9PX37_GULGU|nr:unnamed protein product [Gulo gulo]